MKKFIKILSVMLIVVGLIGCSGGKPKNVSDDIYDLGINALDTTKSFLDGNTTQKEAYTKIETIASRFPKKDKTMEESKIENAVLAIQIILYGSAKADVDNVREAYNTLKERLNK